MDEGRKLGNLAKALAAAQAAFPMVKKGRTAKVKGKTQAGAPYEYEYSYADLADIISAVAPELAKQGLAVTQTYHYSDGWIFLASTLMHAESGEWAQSNLPVATIETAPQKLGSAMTYMRRYAYTALVGVATEEDDDGKGANDAPRPAPKRPRQGNAPAGKPMDAAERRTQIRERIAGAAKRIIARDTEGLELHEKDVPQRLMRSLYKKTRELRGVDADPSEIEDLDSLIEFGRTLDRLRLLRGDDGMLHASDRDVEAEAVFD